MSFDSLDHDGTDVADSDDEKILYADYQVGFSYIWNLSCFYFPYRNQLV